MERQRRHMRGGRGMVLRPTNFTVQGKSKMRNIVKIVSIAILSLSPALANAAALKAVDPTAVQPSVVQHAPIQPLYQTVLPPAYTDDARGG